LASLSALVKLGRLEGKVLTKTMKKYGISANKLDPLYN
jgi:hypothetical protein